MAFLIYLKLTNYTSTDHPLLTPPHIRGNILDLVLTITHYHKTAVRLIPVLNRLQKVVDESSPLVLTNWVTLRLVTSLLRSTELVTSSSTTLFRLVTWILSDYHSLVVLLLKNSPQTKTSVIMKSVVH